MAGKRGPSIQRELLLKSREAALNAVQTFNNPLTVFKAETFIMLMVVAWTYLLHAYYRREGLEYRYYKQGATRKRFDRTRAGAFKYWELEQCLNEDSCPLDRPTQQNLRFLIGLRHEIEHHQSTGVDQRLSGRYLACCLNYERYVCNLFEERYSLGEAVAITLQFRDLSASAPPAESIAPLPSSVSTYLREFDAGLAPDELDSQYFRRRFLFVPVVSNRGAQADEIVEFVRADSELGQSLIDQYERVLLKEVERPKHLPSEIVRIMRDEGYGAFTMHSHTLLWKKLDAKQPGKGYGVQIVNAWYWYDRWLDEVRKHCKENEQLYSAGDLIP